MKYSVFTSFFISPLLLFSQIGIDTETPEATLDINGDLIIRKTDNAINFEDIGFYNMVMDETGKVYKDDSIPSSYSFYLGFDPMAPSHTAELPTPLEPGYITTIDGIAIGACYGAVVDFKLTYKGTDLLSATINRFTTKSIEGASVTIEGINEDTLYSNSLENLPAFMGCGNDYGHKLSATMVDGIKKLSVTFLDLPAYYPDAGTFTVTNVSRIKYIPNNIK